MACASHLLSFTCPPHARPPWQQSSSVKSACVLRHLNVITMNPRQPASIGHYAAGTTQMVVADAAAAQLLEALKGVVIGPTVNEFAAAVAGGTVGVMGTLIALEIGRQRARDRKQCPYCRGSGKLPCGSCYTIGSVPSSTAGPTAQVPCDLCAAKGYVMCMHCEGEGRLLPIDYERALRAQYEDYVYTTDDYYQDGPPYA